MDDVFQKQKGRNIEVYVDDILIKATTANNMISDIRETFATLRRYNLKLNSEKYIFGVRVGVFLVMW